MVQQKAKSKSSSNVSKFNGIYDELKQPLADEAVERASKEITRKGYDTTGYQYQYLVERLNEVVGIENWGMDHDIVKEIEGKFSTGQTYYDITVKIIITIMGISKSLAGGHKSSLYSDALKGAITNGFKKTVALFGLGQDAYKGVIDEDYRSPEYGVQKTKPQVRKPQAKKQTSQRKPVTKKEPDGLDEIDVLKEKAKGYFKRLKWDIKTARKYLGDTSKYDKGDWKLALENLAKECKKIGI